MSNIEIEICARAAVRAATSGNFKRAYGVIDEADLAEDQKSRIYTRVRQMHFRRMEERFRVLDRYPTGVVYARTHRARPRHVAM